MYKCKNVDCDEQFKYLIQLLRHKKKCNKKSPRKKYTHENNCFVCSNCHRSFMHQSNVTRHLKNCAIKTNLTHACPKCDKIFLYKSRLIKHILSHTEKESKTCKKCGKTFRRRDYFANHSRISEYSIDFIPTMSKIVAQSSDNITSEDRTVVSASTESPEFEQIINLEAEISQDQVKISSVSSDLQAMNTSNNVESEVALPFTSNTSNPQPSSTPSKYKVQDILIHTSCEMQNEAIVCNAFITCLKNLNCERRFPTFLS